MANCAVVGCSNSYYRLQRWAKSTCPIHNTRHDECVCKEPFQFFSFPSSKTQQDSRQKWIKNVNRKAGNANWQPTTQSRICSDHFVHGTPTVNNPYPSVNMGYDMAEIINPRKPPIQRFKVTKTQVKSKPKTRKQQLEDIDHDHQYNFRSNCNCTQDCSCEGCLQKERQICLLEEKILSLKEQLKEEKSCLQPKPIHKVLMESDKNVKRFLGMPSKKLFLTLVKVLTPKAKYLRYWKGRQSLKVMSTRVNKLNTTSKTKPGPARKLTITQELMVVFLKLRLNLTNELIAVLFNISASVCSQIITTYLKFLAHQFKCLIFRPTMEEVKATLPDCFKETVPNARGIIDCTEIFIEKPNSHDVQAST
ncbi:hypothetical protein SNE40_019291 [Patella caerulea]|uniref:THAP-type domain-containing protein n=1 Tax=Patella caerulea TaxID=87958 RepID=A0AAN8PI94_PATCE